MSEMNGATVSTSRIIDRARQKFNSLRERYVCKEWGEDDEHPLEVFFAPMTVNDLEAIDARSPKTHHDRNVFTLILKARDEQNQPLFQWGDAISLKTEVEYGIILDIVTAINNLRTITTVDQAKAILGEDGALAFRVRLARLMGKGLEEVQNWPIDHLMLFAADLLVEREESQRS